MIMGANQPYFVPYIGYWQLINAADVFVIGDDYNYIRRGWINRNRILGNGEGEYFNIEVHHPSPNKNINQLYLSEVFNADKKLAQLRTTYRKAPCFDLGYELMQRILYCDENNLANFLECSIQCVCEYLEIKTKLVRSSSFQHNADLKREYRIYDLCKRVGADIYINAPNWQKLYSFEQFRKQGIKLGFIRTGSICYKQFNLSFTPNLSIIDVIMFNSKEVIQQMLNEYEILWEEERSSSGE